MRFGRPLGASRFQENPEGASVDLRGIWDPIGLQNGHNKFNNAYIIPNPDYKYSVFRSGIRCVAGKSITKYFQLKLQTISSRWFRYGFFKEVNKCKKNVS